MEGYKEFLENKAPILVSTGIKNMPKINPMLIDFQSDIVKWALKRGRACIFADCGIGKTPMQFEWAPITEDGTIGEFRLFEVEESS